MGRELPVPRRRRRFGLYHHQLLQQVRHRPCCKAVSWWRMAAWKYSFTLRKASADTGQGGTPQSLQIDGDLHSDPGHALASSRRARFCGRLSGKSARPGGWSARAGAAFIMQRGRPRERQYSGYVAQADHPPLFEGWQVLMEPQEHRPGHQLCEAARWRCRHRLGGEYYSCSSWSPAAGGLSRSARSKTNPPLAKHHRPTTSKTATRGQSTPVTTSKCASPDHVRL